MLVVGDIFAVDKLSRTMGLQVVAHVVSLGLHIGTHLVERRGRDHVALAIDLPGDWGVGRADLVFTGGSGGGSRVLGDSLSHFSVDDHAAHEVGIEIIFIIDNGEDLSLDTNLLRKTGKIAKNRNAAENTVVARSLVLVDGSTGTSRRVWPVDFISVTNFHADTVLPVVFLGEIFVVLIVVVATNLLAWCVVRHQFHRIRRRKGAQIPKCQWTLTGHMSFWK